MKQIDNKKSFVSFEKAPVISLPELSQQISKREKNFDTSSNPNLGKNAISPQAGSHIPIFQASIKNLFTPPPTIVTQSIANKNLPPSFYSNSLNDLEMLKCANKYEKMLSQQCSERQLRQITPIFKARNNNQNIKDFLSMSCGLEREIRHNPLFFNKKIVSGQYFLRGEATFSQIKSLSKSKIEYEEMLIKKCRRTK
ncbi:hypothetical protein SS50377_24531 [Spironucleus salmonicida]|uniref:Uncharacterized protein n=1 Tax=Spironucleus salmonicida TaxID=348837 RepID=V6LQE3_9EUKA|nr:hypothetical protein SS50377_24531 [Spironucleus salmonicida]|eukprot:EST45926.1 Hypothetical protein SS50377_13904 [Spironucleus salmonicida]